jgi:hypothetical protein
MGRLFIPGKEPIECLSSDSCPASDGGGSKAAHGATETAHVVVVGVIVDLHVSNLKGAGIVSSMIEFMENESFSLTIGGNLVASKDVLSSLGASSSSIRCWILIKDPCVVIYWIPHGDERIR